ncbi:MAG: ABC transporter ATP-binding protein [Candidatus Methanomethylicia archaeon]
MKQSMRLLYYVVKQWKFILLIVILTLIGSLAGMYTPILTGRAVNMLVENRLDYILPLTLPIIALIIAQGFIGYITNIISQYTSQKVAFNLRNDVYKHLQELSLGFYKRIDTGQLVARATGDVEVITGFMRMAFTGLISAIFTLAAALYFMTSINVTLTLYAIAPLTIIFFLVRRFAKNMRNIFDLSRELYGQITSHVTEVTSGLRVVRALNAFNLLWNRFISTSNKHLHLSLKAAKLRASTWPFVGFISSLSVLIVIWIGGGMVTSGIMDIGSLVAMAMYAGMITWPFISIGFFTVQYVHGLAAASRIFEILKTEPEVKEVENAIPIEVKRGEVELRDVWFSYDGKNWILKGISFKVNPGEVVAIVGPAGSGKSTLVHLIPRLYDAQKGSILIDGIDVKNIKLDSLRRNIGIVHQDIYIFPETIRNNIAYGKPEASMEEIENVAKIAMLHEFISSLPQGYNTIVGERGINLSGGQRQRLAIARTLLIDPKIIILDDSMSNVDAETEKAIYDAVTKHFKGKTVIMITQRPSTMRLADRIIVIDDGRVVEEGRHEELIVKGGLYSKLIGAISNKPPEI